MRRVIVYTGITLGWVVVWLWLGMSLQSALFALLPGLVFALADKPFNDWWARRNGQKPSTSPRQ